LQYADLDSFSLASVMVYRTLVLRTSPFESRPPSNYVPVFSGRWYEVWKALPSREAIEHLPLGTDANPDGQPSCNAVLSLAARAARQHGSLIAAEGPEPKVIPLAGLRHPRSWPVGLDGTLLPSGPGRLSGVIGTPTRAHLTFWLGGSFRDHVALYVDGRLIGAAGDQLEEPAQLTPLGTDVLDAGRHTVDLRYDGYGWRPGSRGDPFLLGPLVLGVPASRSVLVRVPPARAASLLCGKAFDWIEAVVPS
jgi:hypothetical protein